MTFTLLKSVYVVYDYRFVTAMVLESSSNNRNAFVKSPFCLLCILGENITVLLVSALTFGPLLMSH